MENVSKNLVIPKDMKQKAQQLAKEKGLSLNALIRLALSEYIERKK